MLPGGFAPESVQKAAVGVHFGPVIEINGELTARSDKDAEALGDVIRFGRSMIRLNAKQPDNADLLKLADNIKVANAGAVVHFLDSDRFGAGRQVPGHPGPLQQYRPQARWSEPYRRRAARSEARCTEGRGGRLFFGRETSRRQPGWHRAPPPRYHEICVIYAGRG